MLSSPTKSWGLESQRILNETEPAPYAGILVPIPVWDSYQLDRMQLKAYKEKLGLIDSVGKTTDLSGLYFLGGIALGVAGIALAQSQHQTVIAFLGGAAVGFSLKILIE